MQLTIDIGNSDIVFALSQDKEWAHSWRTPSITDKVAKTYAFEFGNYVWENDINLSDVQTIVLSSVVPSLTPVIREMLVNLFEKEPHIVGISTYNLLPIKLNNPQEIGTDLVANALAAYTLYQQACIIVDFGTALTLTTVSDKGEVLGVAIAPGLKTAMISLSGKTAQLPNVPLICPKSALGKDTPHAMQAGILLGYVGLISYLLDHIQKELGTDCKVIATGGLSSVLKPLHERFDDIEPMLTLDGLRIIGDLINDSVAK